MDEYLLEKKVEYLVDMKLKKLQTQLAEALAKVAEVSEQMGNLSATVKRLNNAPSQSYSQPQSYPQHAQTYAQPGQFAQEAPQQRAPLVIMNKGQAFNVEDVSVEKMFNFGRR